MKVSAGLSSCDMSDSGFQTLTGEKTDALLLLAECSSDGPCDQHQLPVLLQEQ